MNKWSAQSASTIAAYWPTEGYNISYIDNSHKRVLYYFTQSITVHRGVAVYHGLCAVDGNSPTALFVWNICYSLFKYLHLEGSFFV